MNAKSIISSVIPLLAFYVLAAESAPESRLRLNLNPAWRFQAGGPPGEPFAFQYDASKWQLVSLPHSHELFSANLDGFAERGREVGWYRREVDVPKAWLNRKVFIEFQGAMQATTLWVNGREVGTYPVSGFDSFYFDVTSFLREGRNVLAVRTDNRSNPDIPPDGQRMDYVLFGGLYRDVFLRVKGSVLHSATCALP